MSSQGYADFLKAMGHRVILVDDRYWFDSHPLIYMSFPFTAEITPNTIQLSDILGKKGMAARFPCPVNTGRSSYRISITDSSYNLTSLNSKSRNQTRRGLENCEVRALSMDEITKDALKLNTETLLRQGRTLSLTDQEYWAKYYQEIVKAKGTTIWGAFVDNVLASFLISFRMNGCENILIMRSRTSLLKFYPNNALIFRFISAKLSASDIDEVSIGLESIQPDMDSLDHFKLGMGFKKVPIGQYISLRPELAFFLKGMALEVVIKALALFAQRQEKFAKLSGLFKWYKEQQRVYE